MLTAESVSFVLQRFGLQNHGAAWLRINGVVDGVDISMQTSSQNSAEVIVVATRKRGSDVGMHISVSTLWMGAELFSSGDAQFDGIFSRRCAPFYEEQAKAILTVDVRSDLSALSRIGTASLYDDAASAWVVPSQISGPELEHVLRTVAHLSVAADAATSTLGPPRRLVESGIASAVSAFAAENACAFQEHPVAARGQVRDDDFSLRVLENSPARHFANPLHGESSDPGFDVSIRFAEPLRGALKVRPASIVDRAQAVLGIGDIETGDAEFDRTFTLDAKVADDRKREAATQLVREQLNAETRRRMMLLAHSKVAVSFDERGLVARGPRLASGQAVTEVLRALSELRGAMRGELSRGPYR